MTITGRTWEIRKATEHSPFEVEDQVEISEPSLGTVTVRLWRNGELIDEWSEVPYDESKDKVVITMDAVRRELVGSEEFFSRLTMYGMSWLVTPAPDVMAAWVADPQS